MRPNISRISPRTLHRLKFAIEITQAAIATGRTETALFTEAIQQSTSAGIPPLFNSFSSYRSFKTYHSNKLEHPQEILSRIKYSHTIL